VDTDDLVDGDDSDDGDFDVLKWKVNATRKVRPTSRADSLPH
jgi:hypothetical protein